jgi:redox-sensitive bicupin YhaK (pirin superfamily)
MVKIRKSNERGVAEHGWLSSRHTFSFADYYDPNQMGFSVLRVINEDKIVGGSGFPTHAHKDMEIISYVIEGELQHKDSMGNASVIKPGELQRMSAGTGVRHSEFNNFPDKTTHFLQIWIQPEEKNLPPGYGQKDFSTQLNGNDLVLVCSHHGRDGSITINQDIDLYALKSQTQGERILNTDQNRSYWLQVIKGVVKYNDISIAAGDGLSSTALTRIHLKWNQNTEFLLFDLP